MGKAKFYGYVMGSITALITACYFIAFFALPRVDNPSSTEGIAYIFALFYTVIAGTAGSLSGWGLDSLFSEADWAKNKKLLRTVVCTGLTIVFIVFAIVMYLHNKSSQEEYNAKNKIEVKYNTGIVEKNKVSTNDLATFKPDPNTDTNFFNIGFGNQGVQKELRWNEKYFIITCINNDHLFIKNDDGSVFIDHSLEGYNYIISLSYLILDKKEESYLFVLSRLRATSHMSVLNVFSEKGELLYEELMGRFNFLESGEINGEKAVIIGNSQPRGDEVIVTMADFIFNVKE